MNKIRCSMLPGAQDCMRRTIASQFGDKIKQLGFDLNEKKNGIYTAIGNSLHKVNKFAATHKIKNGSLPLVNDCIDYGIENLSINYNNSTEISFDKTTPNKNVGEKQLAEMIKMYFGGILPKLNFEENINPDDYLEKKFNVKLNNYTISGHTDIITRMSIIDIKSGKNLMEYQTQLGGYANVAISSGYRKPKNLIIAHIPRIHPGKKNPGITIVNYDVDYCMVESWRMINVLVETIEKFKQKSDPTVFAANPHSILCNIKYCVAYGTNFCKYFKGQK